MVSWRADIHELNSGTVKLASAPFQHWNMNWILNGPGTVEADMWLKHSSVTYDNFKPGARELRIYRDNVLCWGGYIWTARISRKRQKVRILAQGYFSRLRRRILHQGRIRQDMDTADIAWDLIDWTQTNDGTFNITDGHTDSGFIVDRYYCKSDKARVGESIQELAEMDNSFDFWITPTITDSGNKVFKTAVPRRGTDLSGSISLTGLTLGEDDYEIDAMNLANRLWGEGTGECNPPSFEATAGASITEYGELHDTVEFDDLDHFPSVKAHTREAIRNTKKARELPTLTLEERDLTWGAFDIGDIIEVVRSDGFDSGAKDYRVLTIEYDFIPDNTIAFIRVGVDSVVGA